MTIFKYFLLFMIYSVIGWLIEVIGILLFEKKFVNRGFLIGPYCPIYGCGGLIIFFIGISIKSPLPLFITIVIICSLLEYFVSYILEKVFKVRWWDYSNRKFNINGRICLLNVILFGFLGLSAVYIVNPILIKLLNIIPIVFLNIISISLMILFILDFIVSTNIMFKLKTVKIGVLKDATEEISEKVKQIILSKNKKLQKRLLKAFPYFK